MYQSDFICTYKMMDNETDQEGLYRIQLLQAFDLEVWDDEIFSNTITEIYDQINANSDFQLILEKAHKNASINEMCELLGIPDTEDLIFTMLFKYEYFDLFHRCLADYLTQGSISPKNLNTLLEAL